MCRAQEQELISAEVDLQVAFTRIQSHRLTAQSVQTKIRNSLASLSVPVACARDELVARMIVVSRVDLEHLFPRRLAGSFNHSCERLCSTFRAS